MACAAILLLVAGLASATAIAAEGYQTLPGTLTSFHVVSVQDAFAGKVPPRAPGPYELITATVTGTLDPLAPANQGIVDLVHAPRDTDGLVTYRTDVLVLRPKRARTAVRVLVYDVVNRGGLLGKGTFIGGGDLVDGSGPDRGFPSWLEHGYTIVWSGWQSDLGMSKVGAKGFRLGTDFPAAERDHHPVSGMSREEYIPDSAGGDGHSFQLSYAPADPTDRRGVTFTARERWADAQGREVYRGPSVPVTDWHYVRRTDDDGSARVDVSFAPPARLPDVDGKPAKPDAGTIYSFVYRATGSRVSGIGFAAVRDLVSFLRRHGGTAAGVRNPLDDMVTARCAIRLCDPAKVSNFDAAIAVGVSQSGRFLRDFLYRGFNDDGHGQRVFDGLMPIIAGARRTWVNTRFAQPGRWSKQHEDHFMPGFDFPFAYNVIKNPFSGHVDGLLQACMRSRTCPRIMQVDGSFEWWNGAASLVVTDGAGHDLALPDNVRYYMIPGTGHGGGAGVRTGLSTPPAERKMCRFADSPISEEPFDRALFARLVDWITREKMPPPSQYPSVAAGTAVLPEEVGFPLLDAVRVPSASDSVPVALSVRFRGRYNQVFQTHFKDGVPQVDVHRPYTVLKPVVDATGNETAGIRTPGVAVPLASYAGWNLRSPGHAEGELCGSHGAQLPLASTDAMHSAKDPRPALSQLYEGRDDYLRKVGRAIDQLVGDGYLIERDARNIYRVRAHEVSSALVPPSGKKDG